jgi:uncharacterized protein (UPF0548 family)
MVAEWRLLRGWSEAALLERLHVLAGASRNFAEPPGELARRHGWNQYRSEAVIAYEAPGAPVDDGYFERARVAIANYQFSDPAIVRAHFDPRGPLLERRMLLEISVLFLRYLCGVVIGAVEEAQEEERTRFAFRYDTLDGHIERGAEWFILTKDHGTGRITFRIGAAWQPGDVPNWWSRLGFRLLARRYQLRWHRRAHRRLVGLIHVSLEDLLPEQRRLVTEGPDVEFVWGEEPPTAEREVLRRT